MDKSSYFLPSSVEEAISLCSQYGEKARIISGGTDVVPKAGNNALEYNCLINVNRIDGLNYIKYDLKNGLRIGAATKVAEIAKSEIVNGLFNILTQGANLLGSPAIRNQATIGGNICNASPAADTITPLIVLGAQLRIAGPEGEKNIPIEDFYTGPGATIMKKNQLLIEIQVPTPVPNSGGSYSKHMRSKGHDIAIVGVAAFVTLERKIIKDLKIALGSVAPTPIRAKMAEEILRGKEVDDELLQKAGQAASTECNPIDNIRGSAEYRRKIVGVLTRRAVMQAIKQLGMEG